MSRDFKKRFWTSLVWYVTTLAMILNTLFPAFDALRQARAQEPDPVPTAEATADIPAETTPDAVVTDVPTVEATDVTPTPIEEVATAEATAATAVPTVDLPTLPPPTVELSLFTDNFQDSGTTLESRG